MMLTSTFMLVTCYLIFAVTILTVNCWIGPVPRASRSSFPFESYLDDNNDAINNLVLIEYPNQDLDLSMGPPFPPPPPPPPAPIPPPFHPPLFPQLAQEINIPSYKWMLKSRHDPIDLNRNEIHLLDDDNNKNSNDDFKRLINSNKFKEIQSEINIKFRIQFLNELYGKNGFMMNGKNHHHDHHHDHHRHDHHHHHHHRRRRRHHFHNPHFKLNDDDPIESGILYRSKRDYPIRQMVRNLYRNITFSRTDGILRNGLERITRNYNRNLDLTKFLTQLQRYFTNIQKN